MWSSPAKASDVNARSAARCSCVGFSCLVACGPILSLRSVSADETSGDDGSSTGVAAPDPTQGGSATSAGEPPVVTTSTDDHRDPWVDEIVIDLVPYDGGTRSDLDFTMNGALQEPSQPIWKIASTDDHIVGPGSLGTMTIVRVDDEER